MKIFGGPDYNIALYEAALSGLVEQTAGEWNCEVGNLRGFCGGEHSSAGVVKGHNKVSHTAAARL